MGRRKDCNLTLEPGFSISLGGRRDDDLPALNFSRTNSQRGSTQWARLRGWRPKMGQVYNMAHGLWAEVNKSKISTEMAKKDGTWLREIYSCCCLTTAGKTRQLLLNKMHIPFLPSLYIFVTFLKLQDLHCVEEYQHFEGDWRILPGNVST